MEQGAVLQLCGKEAEATADLAWVGLTATKVPYRRSPVQPGLPWSSVSAAASGASASHELQIQSITGILSTHGC